MLLALFVPDEEVVFRNEVGAELGRLRAVRRGEVTLAEAVDAVAEAEARLVQFQIGPDIPDRADDAWVNDWLHRSHLAYWSR